MSQGQAVCGELAIVADMLSVTKGLYVIRIQCGDVVRHSLTPLPRELALGVKLTVEECYRERPGTSGPVTLTLVPWPRPEEEGGE